MQTVVRKGPLWIVLLLLAACKTHGQANQKPNIFFIAVDDMGRQYEINCKLILSTCLRIAILISYKLSTTFTFVKEIMTLVITIRRWKLRILTTWRTKGLFWNLTTCILSVDFIIYRKEMSNSSRYRWIQSLILSWYVLNIFFASGLGPLSWLDDMLIKLDFKWVEFIIYGFFIYIWLPTLIKCNVLKCLPSLFRCFPSLTSDEFLIHIAI